MEVDKRVEDHHPLEKALLGPPVERLEYGYPFSVVYFSRGTRPTKKGVRGRAPFRRVPDLGFPLQWTAGLKITLLLK